jgi:hypothetical protein
MANFDRLRPDVPRLAACALLAASLIATPVLARGSLKVVFPVSEGDKQARLALFMTKRDLERDPNAKIEIVGHAGRDGRASNAFATTCARSAVADSKSRPGRGTNASGRDASRRGHLTAPHRPG